MKFSRKYGLICLLGVAISLTACKKWLDITPRTQIKESEQFSSRQGFIDALFGIYQRAATDSMYGNSLSFGVLDVLAGRYENKSGIGNWYGGLARYNYTSTASGTLNVERKISEIWGAAYNAIAQANYILKNVDSHRDILDETTYGIIKGETLGMRAFMHFDLLRLYAPAYNTANAQKPAIPYMELFTVVPQDRLTVAAVTDKCEKELLEAETLLSVNKDIDQIAGNQGSTSADLFLMYRQNHLNYWAVKATLARLYLYKGDKVNALKYAKEVIDSKKFRFITAAEINNDASTTASDMTFSSEHIFSIYVSDLRRVVEELFKQTPNNNNNDSRDLYTALSKVNAMYEKDLPFYGTDIRLPDASKSLWTPATIVGVAYVYSKKYHADNPNNVKQRLIPVLRLPEMYYIAAEAAPTPDEGLTYLNTVRVARGLPALTASDKLEAEILKEYRKEFYGEGQLWFYFKRKNTITIPDGTGIIMTEAAYTFPRPQAEIEFGK
ncbi:RagB/SusD family nutrient uptake outer membrane protein [Chitinophaga sp. SYP-B3965]|uniref:RagB/SusD family nutrient uptake outer membrane protein n=1 Tax=Chitinophaga sp. SYP-B3965 TaxID=2663120 RepID=UPI0015679060|nr:RagB/SusD family nutrient uptake outer membrane protein [Chitinophaga sp. SYP-B3965]